MHKIELAVKRRNIAIIGLLCIFVIGAALWKSLGGPSSVSTASAGTPNTAHGVARTTSDTSFDSPAASAQSMVPPSAGGTHSTNARTQGLFGESLRKLLNTNQLAKIDYAMLRLLIPCEAVKGAGSAEAMPAPMSREDTAQRSAELLGIGTASDKVKQDASTRFGELCLKILEDDKLSAGEFKQATTNPGVIRWREIARAINDPAGGSLDLSNAKTKAALEAVITTPMYGLLENLLYTRLDVEPLRTAYSQDEINNLSNLIVPILLCRMGDDCGPDGFATLQLCRQHGICGNDLEQAVWAHLQARQLDTIALQRFVDRSFLSLRAFDLSILKLAK
jgi:hypothetical protein